MRDDDLHVRHHVCAEHEGRWWGIAHVLTCRITADSIHARGSVECTSCQKQLTNRYGTHSSDWEGLAALLALITPNPKGLNTCRTRNLEAAQAFRAMLPEPAHLHLPSPQRSCPCSVPPRPIGAQPTHARTENTCLYHSSALSVAPVLLSDSAALALCIQPPLRPSSSCFSHHRPYCCCCS